MNIWYAVNLIDILLPSFVGFAYHENQILIALCTAVSRYVCVVWKTITIWNCLMLIFSVFRLVAKPIPGPKYLIAFYLRCGIFGQQSKAKRSTNCIQCSRILRMLRLYFPPFSLRLLKILAKVYIYNVGIRLLLTTTQWSQNTHFDGNIHTMSSNSPFSLWKLIERLGGSSGVKWINIL